MTTGIIALLNRVVGLQQAVPLVNSSGNSVTAEAYPYFLYFQDTFPYWVNRIEGPEPIEDDSEALEEPTYDVVMRLVVDHVTAGAAHERELDLYAYIPVVKAYFAARRDLMDDTFTTELTGLWSAELRPGGNGLRIYAQSGIGVQQLGTEFTLRCRYVEDVNQVKL